MTKLIDDPRDQNRAHDEASLMTTFRKERVTRRNVEIADPPF